MSARTAIGAAIAFALAVVLLFPFRSVHATAGDISAIFGSVLAVEAKSVALATDTAVIKLQIDADTGIRIGDVDGSPADIEIGDRVAATAVEGAGGALLAKNILVRPKSGIQVKHVVGIVVASGAGNATVLDRDGNTVTFYLPAGARVPHVGEAVTAVTRRDLATGRIEARATERAEDTIARIEDHLDALQDRLEIDSIRRAEQLRQMLQEDTRRHLGALAEVAGQVSSDGGQLADEVRDDTREKLEEARTRYAEAARKRGLETGNVQVEGLIGGVSDGQFELNLRGGGQAVFTVNASTRVLVDGVDSGVAGIVDGSTAVVEFDAELNATRPLALRVRLTAPKLSSDVAANLKISAASLVDGVIARVESPAGLDNVIAVVVVVNDDSGSTVAIKAIADTKVTVNGKQANVADLKPGQRATVSFDQSLKASAIRAYAQDAGQRAIEGIVSKIDATNRVLAIAPARGDVVVISVGDAARIERDGGVGATFEQLKVNDLVLTGSRFDRTTGEAVLLIVRSPNFEANGVISGVSREDRVVTIRPREGDIFKLLITGESEIVAKGGGPIGLADIEPGLQVQVAWRVAVVGEGPRNVLVRMVVSRPESVAIQGTVVRVDAGAGVLVVQTSDRRVELRLPDGDQKVELIKNGHAIESLRPILEGDQVHKAVYQPAQKVIRSLEVVSLSAVQARGQMKGFDPSSGTIKLFVSNEKILTLAVVNDSILTSKGERVPFASLAGRKQIALDVLYASKTRGGTDGVILAAEVLLGQTDSDADSVEVKAVGTIKAIEGSVWVINDTQFVVIEGKTRIVGKPAVGAMAKAALVGERGGMLTATEIEVQDAPATAEAPARPTATPSAGTRDTKGGTLTGVIEALDGDVIVVNGLKIVLLPNALEKAQRGMRVKCEVQKTDRGTIEATRCAPVVVPTPRPVSTLPPAPERTVEGLVQEVNGDVIVISGTKIVLLPKAVERVERGMMLKCFIRRTNAGVIEATRCSAVASSPTPRPVPTATAVVEDVVEGIVQEVDGDVIVVNGRRIVRLPGALDKAERGMKVDCRVRKTDRGVFEATRCTATAASPQPTPTPIQIRFSGTISDLYGRVWVVDGRKYVLAANAAVPGTAKPGARVSGTYLVDGDQLTVVSAEVEAPPALRSATPVPTGY